MFLVLVKIAPGCFKCPRHSQSRKLPGQSDFPLGQRAAQTQFLCCGTVVKRRTRGFRLVKVKTPQLSMKAIHAVASKNGCLFSQQL